MRRLDAADITVLIDENADVDIVEAREVVAERAGLMTAQLEQQRTASPQESRRVGEHASQDLAAVAPAGVGERRLECERIALQQWQGGRRHVGHHADDHVDAPLERAGKRREQVAEVDLDAVRHRAGNGPLVEVGRDDARAGVLAHQRPRDRSRPGAEIDGRPVVRQPLRGATRQRLTLPAGDVDARIDADLQAAKGDPPDNPCEGLARKAARYQRVEELAIPGRAREKRVGLLVCGDEPGARQHRGKRRRVLAHYGLPPTASSTRQVLPAALSQVNSVLRAPPAAISRRCNAPSLASSSIAWLQAPASSGLSRMPAVPTISGSAPAVDAMTAVPQAIASRAGKPKPSKREGSVSAMAPAYRAGRSSAGTYGRTLALPPDAASWPGPARISSASRPRRRASSKARRNIVRFFRGWSRPT